MGKLAFVFSGQGDQYPGMGRDLYERYPAARRVFDRCDALRPGTAAQCFEGSEEQLRNTAVTQPCLYAVELAAAQVLLERGVVPHAAAGFSLGEVAAAAVCGVFDWETGFRLVCRRGELMQRAAESCDTAMAAVLRLTPEQVRRLCEGYPEVYPVNFNGPGQITVSGRTEQMVDFYTQVRKVGGRALPLKVTGGFHAPFMAGAAEAFAGELARVRLNRPTIPLYSDYTGEIYGENPAELLAKQICNPVLWEQVVRNLIADGVDTFVELGPGRTLCNMIKKIDSNVTVKTATDYDTEELPC